MTFVIKQNDTSPSLQTQLLDADDVPINLTDATVTFIMKDFNTGIVLNTPMTVVTPANGVVQYDWQTGDTANTGTFYVEFKVEYANGAVETFPNFSNATIVVYPSL